jgi:hypothetical protein
MVPQAATSRADFRSVKRHAKLTEFGHAVDDGPEVAIGDRLLKGGGDVAEAVGNAPFIGVHCDSPFHCFA